MAATEKKTHTTVANFEKRFAHFFAPHEAFKNKADTEKKQQNDSKESEKPAAKEVSHETYDNYFLTPRR